MEYTNLGGGSHCLELGELSITWSKREAMVSISGEPLHAAVLPWCRGMSAVDTRHNRKVAAERILREALANYDTLAVDRIKSLEAEIDARYTDYLEARNKLARFRDVTER